MAREMVKVILFEDGTYEVNDIPNDYVTQKLCGFYNGKRCDIYYCLKPKWKYYLLKLLSTSTRNIDKQISELQRKKENRLKLRGEILKEIIEED